MAIDVRKRQKKLERRKAKQKAERRELARRDSRSLAVRLQAASVYPILHCCVSADLWEQGIGYVLMSRQAPNGQVAFAAFLVDVYCLGVKDVMIGVDPMGQYRRDMYDRFSQCRPLIPWKPECARKFVEGAVKYALDLGLPPHADYRVAKLIFGEIQAETMQEYTFGKDGKPFFIAGPYDSPARCQQVLRTLERCCGPGGHNAVLSFVMPSE